LTSFWDILFKAKGKLAETASMGCFINGCCRKSSWDVLANNHVCPTPGKRQQQSMSWEEITDTGDVRMKVTEEMLWAA